MLGADITKAISRADDPLIKTLFPVAVEAPGGRGGGRRRGGSKKKTVGGQFKASLQELYVTLTATTPWFIKCVKPNNVKQPGVFDSVFSLRQLQYLGLLEVIRIRRAGYPVRMTPEQFYGRYAVIDGAAKDPDALMASVGVKDQWQKGKTKFFFRDQMFQQLEDKRGAAMENVRRCESTFTRVCLFTCFDACERARVAPSDARVWYFVLLALTFPFVAGRSYDPGYAQV